MIHKFSATNFFTFEGEVQIDFRVDDNAPSSPAYFKTKGGARLSTVEVVMGPNASGKTTALKALAFISWLLVDSFRHNSGELPVASFAASKENSITEVSVEFEMDKGLHTYTVGLNKTRILREELLVRNLTRERTTTKKLFLRNWDSKNEEYVIEDFAFNLREDYWSSSELYDTSVIAAANRMGHEYAKEIVKYWRRFETNIEINYEAFIPYRYKAYRALMYYEKHEESKKKAEKEARRYADLGIDSFGKDGVIRHRFGDNFFELELEHESSGTQQFLTLTRMIEEALEKGGIAVIDEFNAFLHPLMLQSLVDKFLNPRINKKRAQLLISGHEFHLFNLLDKYQINLARKNSRGATNIKRLDELKGVRADENFLAKYMSGSYGALPKIK